MKKIILAIIVCTALHLHTISYNHLKQGLFNGLVGSTLLAITAYSTGETLLDCGHGYYELKKEYFRYLLELEVLEHTYIMTPREKHFWALNQAISKIPKVFWPEIIAGTFTVFTGILAYKQLGKSINHFTSGI